MACLVTYLYIVDDITDADKYTTIQENWKKFNDVVKS